MGLNGDVSRVKMIGLLVAYWPKQLSLLKDMQGIPLKDLCTMCEVHGVSTKGLSKRKLANMLVELQKNGKITPVEASSSEDEEDEDQ
jgi:hypothetical protein